MSNLTLYLISVLIWGSTWLAIEFQLGVVDPAVSIVYRYLLGAALLFVWVRAKGLPLRFSVRAHGWFALLGMCLFSVNYMFAYYAQVYITSALSAVAFSSLLWMNILLSWLVYGERAERGVLLGAALGIVGIVVLFAPRIEVASFDDRVMIGSVLAMSGAFVASWGNMVSLKTQSLKLPVLQSNAWGMLYGAVLTGLFALATGQTFSFDTSTGYVISLVYLSVFGSVVAFWAYLTLLGRIGANKAGYAVVMFPVVAMILSIAFEGLRLDLPIVLGVALVAAGNVFVLKGTQRRGKV
jgi:drug/metabolite transporter (DMT)-like permease